MRATLIHVGHKHRTSDVRCLCPVEVRLPPPAHGEQHIKTSHLLGNPIVDNNLHTC